MRSRKCRSSTLTKTADDWASMSRILFVPHTESEYRHLVGLLDTLIDEVGEDESLGG